MDDEHADHYHHEANLFKPGKGAAKAEPDEAGHVHDVNEVAVEGELLEEDDDDDGEDDDYELGGEATGPEDGSSPKEADEDVHQAFWEDEDLVAAAAARRDRWKNEQRRG